MLSATTQDKQPMTVLSASPLSNKIKSLDLSLLANDEDWDKPATQKVLEEPLLVPQSKRFVLFPIQYNTVCFYFYLNIWRMYIFFLWGVLANLRT